MDDLDVCEKLKRERITEYLYPALSATTANIAANMIGGGESLLTWVFWRETLDAMVHDGLCEKEEIRGLVYFRLTEKGRACKQDCSTAE